MNNINDILNKTYQRIGSTNGDTYHAKQIEGEFVIFSNGAKIKLTTLLADFQVVGATPIVNENQTSFTTNDEIDAESFFNSTAPVPEVKTVDKIQPTEAPSIIDGKLALNSNSNSNQLGGLNLTDDANQTQIQSENNTSTVQQNRLPEWDSFDRVKKTEDVELNVTIKIKLPKARHIDAINDMYETSFTSYLAKKYTMDPINIQTQIREAIEEWVEIEMNGGKHPKKKTSKTVKNKDIKKSEKAEPFVLPSTSQIEPIKSGTAAAMFGQPQIEKDVTKLAVIVEEEQYIAAKEYFSKLEPSHKDYYRFEGMITLWEDENNSK